MPDWLGQSTVAANGIATVLLNQQNASVIWEVEQIGVSVGTASTTGNVVIYKNGNLVAPTAILAPQVTTFGTVAIGQTAAGLPYVYVQPADTLQIVGSGLVAGDLMTVRAQYREFPLNDPDVRGR